MAPNHGAERSTFCLSTSSCHGRLSCSSASEAAAAVFLQPLVPGQERLLDLERQLGGGAPSPTGGALLPAWAAWTQKKKRKEQGGGLAACPSRSAGCGVGAGSGCR